jgi:hypothetical protein
MLVEGLWFVAVSAPTMLALEQRVKTDLLGQKLAVLDALAAAGQHDCHAPATASEPPSEEEYRSVDDLLDEMSDDGGR